jgi:hypothetical protein
MFDVEHRAVLALLMVRTLEALATAFALAGGQIPAEPSWYVWLSTWNFRVQTILVPRGHRTKAAILYVSEEPEQGIVGSGVIVNRQLRPVCAIGIRQDVEGCFRVFGCETDVRACPPAH